MKAQKKDRRLILLGAGNAHLQAVRHLWMQPLKDTEVVLVSEATEIPYSAMLPAYIAGDFSWVDISFDLVKFCASHGVRWVEGAITNIDLEAKRIDFQNRASLEFDVVSLNTGSQPLAPLGFKPSSDFFLTKPLSALAKHIDRLTERWKENPLPRRFAVVGGGAGGLELALAISKRWSGMSTKIEVIESSARLLPHNPPKAGALFEERLRVAGVSIRLNASVARMDDGGLILESGEKLLFDGGVLATKAAPNFWLKDTPLDKDENGFMKVNRCLQSVSRDFVFGAGDAVAFPDPLPKAGVFAVREGPILAQNLSRYLDGARLHRYKPQKLYLALFNTSDQEAVMCYGPLVLKGNWARRWKDRIDKSWMDRFAGKMRTMPEGQMFCGGCASKLDALTLEKGLFALSAPSKDHQILAGIEAFEDAALLKRGKGVEGFTVDFFRAFIDDPYLLGQVAAINALNDLWAKGLTPKFALSMVGIPDSWTPSYQKRYLEELMAGANSSLQAERVALVGGHTSQLADPMIGFSVWGEGPDEIYLKKALLPGDQLFLTKPLGTGILLAALMRGNCRAAWFSSLIESMRLPHSSILPLLSQLGVKACTDISGFGLARHLLDMCRQSKVGVNIDSNGLPELPGTFEMMNEHIFSQLHGDNKKAVEGFVEGQLNEVAFDPQTSGGLLIAIRPEKAEALLAGLKAAGFIHAMKIGEVVQSERARLSI